MTDPHPLTDEMCENISYFPLSDMPYLFKIIKKDMRAAYDKGRDDQWEQVIEWLKNNLTRSIYLSPKDYYGDEINVDDLLDDLKAEMRPQEGS